MTNEQKIQWQRHVAAAIIDPAGTTAADKIHLLAEWPILRAWAQSVLKRDPNKVPAKTIDAYLRDALAWSGHLGDPAILLSQQRKMQPGMLTYDKPPTAEQVKNHVQQVAKYIKQGLDTKKPTSAPCDASQGNQDANKEQNRRPTHYDQYRHVMPEELNQRFDAEISDLYLLRSDLATRRDNLADLVEQAMYAGEEKTEDEASAQLSDVAQQLVNVDATIRSFWALVDVAFHYYELNGEIMPIEDLREQAPVSVDSSAGKRQRAPRTPDHTKAEIEAMTDLEEQAAQKAERIRKNYNFLRDKRKADNARTNGGKTFEKWREQVLLRAKEMEEWGEELTEVQQEIVALAQ